uniref:Ig-like domain-containing protein n=1 Tax=Lynx canadensis TaxID=61383 RepID=A0A667I1G5_LYNCA
MGAQFPRTDGSLAGLCAGQGSRGTDEPLPKPTLRAWPSWVAPPRSSVRLRCQTPTKDVDFVLKKGNVVLDFSPSPASKEGLAEFHLTDLRSSHAGDYTCECYRPGAPDIRSPPSEVILLLVTGGLPKPSLQAHQRGVVTAGDDVTLQCQRPDNIFGPMRFALLKAGAAGPIRLRTPAGREVDFSLQTVTVGDAGNYSCVYFQTGTPFWASQPSDRLEIRVRGEGFTIGRTPAGLPARSGAASLCPQDSAAWSSHLGRTEGGPGFCGIEQRIFC